MDTLIRRDLKCDGFVVVSRWLRARHARNSYAYENFDTLAQAVGYHRRLVAGFVRDFAAHGIFAVQDGMPVGGALPLEAIAVVKAEAAPTPGLHEYERNSPENMMLREAARSDSRPPQREDA